MSQQLKNITRTSKIFVRNNDVDKALRILKKKLLLEGVVKEVREKRHFTPPGEKRRLEAKAGRKRWLKKREQIEQRMVRAEQNAMRKNRNKNKKHVPRQDKNSSRPQHSNNTPRFKSK
jgi:small subunit ribosomal protein S21